MKYRPEIDGLRALAVIPVIFYHAGFKAFSGGFVGVDVFFVISGYLITSLILAEKEKGTFTLIGFYERRVRRILPALYTVMLVCLPFALMWMWPSDVKDFFHSILAVVTFVSNILFWQEKGYFDAVAELKPLLHTWSLAVEEQYYVCFPLLLVFLWRFGQRASIVILSGLAVASLTMAQFWAYSHPSANFYLLPTRVWEVLLGSLIGIFLFRYETSVARTPGRVLREALAAAGVLMILISVFCFDERTPFPGIDALLPTAGTGLLILFAKQGTFVGRIFSWWPIVGIGLISYSAYLWHQPMFAFARHNSIGELSTAAYVGMSLAVFPLSYLSWRFVESPFRDKKRLARKQVFTFAAIASTFFICIGVIGSLNNNLGRRLPPNVEWESFGAKFDTQGEVCSPTGLANYPGLQICFFGDQAADKVIGLYGDSHARAISSELNKTLGERHYKGVKLVADGCETVPGVFERRRSSQGQIAACAVSYQSLLAYVRDHTDGIVVTSRWTFYLYPTPGEVNELSFDNGEGGYERNTDQEMLAKAADGRLVTRAAEKQLAVEAFLDSLLNTGKKIVLVYPVPEVGWDIAKLNYENYSEYGSPLPQISTSYERYKERNRFIISIFDRFDSSGLAVVRPDEIFCTSFIIGRCVAQYDGVPFYYDDDHVSDAGARMIVARIAEKLP